MRHLGAPAEPHQYRVTSGAPADGRSVRELHLSEDIWVSLIVRDGGSLPVSSRTTLQAEDEVLLLLDPGSGADTCAIFTRDEGT